MKKIVAIVGSPRPDGNTSYLTDVALEEAKTGGCEVEKINLCQYQINPCQGHDLCSTYDKCKIDDDLPMILDKFRAADGTILATPVYCYNMTAQMKIFIDRNYFGYTHHVRPKSRCMGLIIVAGSSGTDLTEQAIKRCFKLKDISNDDWPVVTGFARRIGDVQKNTELIASARELGRKMAEMVNK